MWDKHSKEEYDNRIMGANATNMTANATTIGAKKKRKNVSAHSRQETWGTSVIDRISEQLRRELLGLRGFSSQNIRNMRSFYEYWRQYIICSPWRANYKSVAELRFPIFEFQI